jgi:putative ATP-dependent endonuclease of OLD family
MIRKIVVEDFRSLKRVEIPFEKDITVLVGENDSGKTSVVDILKVIFEGKSLENDDFYYGSQKVTIEAVIDGSTFLLEFSKNEEGIQSEILIELEDEYINKLNAELNSDDFELLNESEKRKKLMNYAAILGVDFRSNIGTETLKDRTLEKLKEILDNGIRNIKSNIPDKNTYFLDGKHFEDISVFFKEMFFKEMRKEIWNEKIGEKTIEAIIMEKLENYSKALTAQIEKRGIKDKIKDYLPELTEIIIRPTFEPQIMNIGVNVQFLEGTSEISIEKKGDGTKRRVTMALLEYEKSLGENGPSLFVFDEPDTHLHVRAQVELLDIIHQFCDDGKQVIIATHSPFIMNSVKPKQIRLLSLEDRITKLTPISSDENIEWTLRSLGVENVHLFFSRNLVVVEGDTEEVFVPLIYEKLYGKNLHSNLIRVINRKGITDVPRFAEVLSEFVKPESIFILIDNDADPKTEELVRRLNIPSENIFKIGYKEFEDAFEPEIIFDSWKEFIESKGHCAGNSWTTDNIRQRKEKCTKGKAKFSKTLRGLNADCQVRMTKRALGEALARHCKEQELPKEICKLLQKLQ